MRGRSKNRDDTSENEFLSQPNINNSLLTASKQPAARPEQFMSKYTIGKAGTRSSATWKIATSAYAPS